MKKTILAAVLLIAASPTFADYESAAIRQSLCKTAGEINVDILKMKKEGKSKEQAIKDAVTPFDDGRTPRLHKIMSKSVDYIYSMSAIDNQDAYMYGWALCMDRED